MQKVLEGVKKVLESPGIWINFFGGNYDLVYPSDIFILLVFTNWVALQIQMTIS